MMRCVFALFSLWHISSAQTLDEAYPILRAQDIHDGNILPDAFLVVGVEPAGSGSYDEGPRRRRLLYNRVVDRTATGVYAGYEYYLTPGTHTNADHEVLAREWGGELVSIHSEEEKTFVIGILNEAGSGITNSDKITTALNGAHTDTTWVWTDGTPYDFTDFWGANSNSVQTMGVLIDGAMQGIDVAETAGERRGIWKRPAMCPADLYTFQTLVSCPQISFSSTSRPLFCKRKSTYNLLRYQTPEVCCCLITCHSSCTECFGTHNNQCTACEGGSSPVDYTCQ
uniref:C-type lectin domain-containing protein n=1 Tax=Corethron hystrix TaxID=216773 RepID=A0A7S1BZK4_9STRA|mmetsp:Transcript_8237/g.17893  ORF Transcript_8237/g.17893 Transcript_8237/m.17893 type:complete len:283 (+) Transcript_8237:73-921(+)